MQSTELKLIWIVLAAVLLGMMVVLAQQWLLNRIESKTLHSIGDKP